MEKNIIVDKNQQELIKDLFDAYVYGIELELKTNLSEVLINRMRTKIKTVFNIEV